MKKIFILIFSLMFSISYAKHYNDLPSSCIKPDGWAKEFLERQLTGLTGHPEQSGFPFNSGMYTVPMDWRDREIPTGADWWPYEQTAYYLDGALRCGYLLNSNNLLDRVHKNINYILADTTELHRIHAGIAKDDNWPMVLIIRMLLEEYDNTHNPKILEALQKYYRVRYDYEADLSIKDDGVWQNFKGRALLHVANLCHVYGLTKDKWFLDVAEKMFSNVDVLDIEAEGKVMHAVTYHEFLKLPIILYYYTNNPKYKVIFDKAYTRLQNVHVMIDGLPSGVEHLNGKDAETGHELCNAIEYSWSSGWALLATGISEYADNIEKEIFNAGFGQITPDFRAHQYYGTPNLINASDMNCLYNADSKGWGFNSRQRFTYRPGHTTECCTGNIHRLFPTFMNRACMYNGNQVLLNFFLPATYDIPFEKGSLKFKVETNYPFEHSVTINILEISKNKQIGFRIPQWAKDYTVSLNNDDLLSSMAGGYCIIKTALKAGDQINFELKSKPLLKNSLKGAYVQYGPLVFSFPIPYKMLTTTYDGVNKCSKDFPAYQFIPKSGTVIWAYGINSDQNGLELVKNKNSKVLYPWEKLGFVYPKQQKRGNISTLSKVEDFPLVIKIKARPVKNWERKEGITNSVYPDKCDFGDEETLYLLPMGNTFLRLSDFPIYKK